MAEVVHHLLIKLVMKFGRMTLIKLRTLKQFRYCRTFLANSRELQAKVLNRMLKIFSGHLKSYKLCQQLKTRSLPILNMDDFLPSSQEIILENLGYAPIIVKSISEQESPSLCCLLL